MPRRPLLLLSSFGLVFGLGLGSSGCGSDGVLPPPVEIERRARPLLLVTLDTTRADRLQPYGATDVATPTMLRLAREGIVFEEAMSVAPITLVAHTSLLTGLYPPSHGVRNNGIHVAAEDLQTLPEALAEAGYATAAFVSASVLEARYGLDQGFDFYDDDLSKGTNRQPRVVPDRPANATVDAALAWLDALEAPEAERFFLWVHFYDPHAVYSPPAPYRDRYRQRPYDGEIAFMDAELGRLLEHPTLQDAAVAVIGDHGESLGEHGEQTHAILAYQATLHVPFFLRVPEGPQGRRIGTPVSQVDVLPTLLDLLDLPALDGAIEGQSLLPLIESGGRPSASEPAPPDHYAETYLPFYTYGWAKLRVLRRGDWKLIDGPDPELFRLSKDPDEAKDLGEIEKDRLETLRADLQGRLGEDGDLEANLELDEEARNRLRSLGYLAASEAPARSGPRPDPKAFVDLHVSLERARGLLRERKAKEAERELRRVLDRDASNLAALTELATARDLAGDLEGAAAAAERALALDPGDARLYVLMARLEMRLERPEKADELLEAALEVSPGHLEAQLERIHLLSRQNRLPEAEEALTALVMNHGEHPRVWLAQARLSRDAEAALVWIRQALERDPHLIQGWRLLGAHLERKGDVEEAIAAYQSGLERMPDDVELHGSLGQLLARSGGDAEIHLREALRLSGIPRPEVLASLGAHVAEKGRFREALELYAEVLEIQPKHLGARNNRAVALYQSGQVDKALQELKELAKENPRHADAHNNLAALALDRGLWQEALGHARRALRVAPAHADGWLNRGLAEHGLGRLEAAEKSYRRSLETEPGLAMARFHLGRLLATVPGRSSESADLLRQVAAELPSFSEPHLLLGELYAGALADPRRARAHLNAFLRLVEPERSGLSAPRQRQSGAADPRIPEVRRRLAELSLRGSV